ncbi:hypothetical protein Tco_0476377 [Tanacetum coccineum]
MAAFKVLETQFQMFIKSRIYLDDKYKLIDKRALHKREYDSRVNERQMQTTEEEVDTSKVLDASLVETENIKPVYDKEPMAENAEPCHDIRPLPAKLTDNQTTKLSNQSLKSENICLKKTVAQFQKDFLRMEAHCIALELKYQNQALKEGQHGQFSKVKSNEAKEKGFAIAALKNELRKLKGNSVNTKSAKSSILGKPVLQPHRNQLVVRQPTVFKSERPRISKPWFAYQVNVNNDLSKPVTTHYLPKGKESACAKPHHMIAPSSSRYSSNDMVHNHYLEEAKKKTQESGRTSRPSVMPSARSQSTANGSKPKSRINNQKSRNWPASKTSYVTTKTVPIAEHSRNSRNFFDSKHFVCSTCQKCVFNANHDACVTKFLNEVNSRTKFPSHKTTNRNKPVEKTSVAKKPKRQIPTGQRVSIKKTFVVHEKTKTPRSVLVQGFKEFCSDEQAMNSDHNSSELGIHDHNNEPSSSKLVPKVVPSADTTAPSKQESYLLFGPLYDEFFNAGTSSVNKSSSPTDNSKQQDTPPSATAQSTTELITPTTTITAEDNM